VRLYLQTGDERHRADAERWLARLTEKPRPQMDTDGHR
jgi:hypothetical protein